MDVKAAKRVSVYDRLGGRGGQPAKNKVCTYWLAGRCNRNPCRFLHTDSQHLKSSTSTWKNPNFCNPKKASEFSKNAVFADLKYQERVIGLSSGRTGPKRTRPEVSHHHHDVPTSTDGRKIGQEAVNGSICNQQTTESVQKPQPKLCEYWARDSCVRGDTCKDVHSWFCGGSGFTMLGKLEGHIKGVTGIALPSGSDKLFSVSKLDGSIRVWDCNSGQCSGVVDVNGEVGCLISELGPWLFAGLPNAIKAWNFKTQTELTLDHGPHVGLGQVYSMISKNDMLFAGTEDGTILAWKFGTDQTDIPQLAATLKGHNGGVCSLSVGPNNRLYSGSTDNTVRVWDLERLQCVETLRGHTRDVTSVICWDRYLLSASLDNTIKVWDATESGNLEVIYEHKEEYGIVALCGMRDAEAKPILFCSCKDNTVRLYDLPSFNERGRLFSKGEVQVIQVGIGGLFFTGDATGQLSVWKFLGAPPCAT